MTTPDTAAVRAWARENGLEVSARGRLPAELRNAYEAAQAAGPPAAPKRTPAKAAAGRSRPAKAAPAKPSAAAKPGGSRTARVKAPAKTPAAKAAAARVATGAVESPEVGGPIEALATELLAGSGGSPEGSTPGDTTEPAVQAPVDPRILALELQLEALESRVRALEQAPPPTVAPPRSFFRRRSS